MTDFSLISITFSECLAQLKRNDSFCTKMNLGSKQLYTLNETDKLSFCSALEKNTTLTSLNITGNVINEFISFLINSLRNNKAITTLYYDKDGLSKESIKAIQEILERNRKLTLNRPINPTKIQVNFIGEEAEIVKYNAFNAAKNGEIDLLYTLILQNPDLLYETDSLNGSLLHLASKSGQVDCVKLLVQLGAEVDLNPMDCLGTPQGTALNMAVNNDHIVIVQLLLNAGASLSSRRNGLTCLHEVHDLEIAQLLVANHADVRATVDNEPHAPICSGNSVLHSAFHNKACSPDLLRFLIVNGAQVNAANKHGETPLHTLVMQIYQTKNGFLARLNILIQAGANPLLKDTMGRTPLDLAKLIQSKWIEVMDIVTKDYIRIRKSSLLLGQGQRHSSCFFSCLPSELLTAIAKFTTDSELLDEKSKFTAAINNFGKP